MENISGRDIAFARLTLAVTLLVHISSSATSARGFTAPFPQVSGKYLEVKDVIPTLNDSTSTLPSSVAPFPLTSAYDCHAGTSSLNGSFAAASQPTITCAPSVNASLSEATRSITSPPAVGTRLQSDLSLTITPLSVPTTPSTRGNATVTPFAATYTLMTSSSLSSATPTCQASTTYNGTACVQETFVQQHAVGVAITGAAAAVTGLAVAGYFVHKRRHQRDKKDRPPLGAFFVNRDVEASHDMLGRRNSEPLTQSSLARLEKQAASREPRRSSDREDARKPAQIRTVRYEDPSFQIRVDESSPTLSEYQALRGLPLHEDGEKAQDGDSLASPKEDRRFRDTIMPNESASQLCSPLREDDMPRVEPIRLGESVYGDRLHPYSNYKMTEQGRWREAEGADTTREISSPVAKQEVDIEESPETFDTVVLDDTNMRLDPASAEAHSAMDDQKVFPSARQRLVSSALEMSIADKHVSGVTSFLGDLLSQEEQERYDREDDFYNSRLPPRFDEDDETVLSYMPPTFKSPRRRHGAELSGMETIVEEGINGRT